MIRYQKPGEVARKVVPVVPRVPSPVTAELLDAKIIVPASGLVLYDKKPKPWEDEGLSRAAWYRRRKRVGAQ